MSSLEREETASGILFACNMNSIRSPMAESIAKQMLGGAVPVDSVGVYEGATDPFIQLILAEDGTDLGDHIPKTFADIDPRDFRTVVVLTKEAAQEAEKFFPPTAIEYWAIPNPTDERGSREQLMNAYREARDILKKRIFSRFGALVP